MSAYEVLASPHNGIGAKERDRILASELWKALLEKNETMVDIFSEHLRCLAQEKYRLKRQIEIIEVGYKQRISHIQTDIHDLKNVLISYKQLEKHLSQLLTEQNQGMPIQSGHIESLHNDISTVINKMTERENQIRFLSVEKANLTEAMGQSSEQLRRTEWKLKDQVHIARRRVKNMEEARAGNLLAWFETMSTPCHLSLLSDIEMPGSDRGEQSSSQELFGAVEEADEGFCFDDTEGSRDEDDDTDMDGLRKGVLSASQPLGGMGLLAGQGERPVLEDSPGCSVESPSSEPDLEVVHVRDGRLNHDMGRTSSSSSKDCQTYGRGLQERRNLERDECDIQEAYLEEHRVEREMINAERVVADRDDERHSDKAKGGDPPLNPWPWLDYGSKSVEYSHFFP